MVLKKACVLVHIYCWLISLCFRYFKKPLNIFLGFIPEIVFMASLFGYLVLLVFYKWTAYDAYSSKDAPSLLIHFINMCLFNYNDPTNKALYPGQVLALKSPSFASSNMFHSLDTNIVFSHYYKLKIIITIQKKLT